MGHIDLLLRSSTWKSVKKNGKRWKELSSWERVAKIDLVDKAGANSYNVDQLQSSTCDDSQLSASLSQAQKLESFPDFECTGLPEILLGLWKNVDIILKRDGVTKVAGAVSTYVVISLTKPSQPHIVNVFKKNVSCNCEGFKERKICTHNLAVSHVEGILHELVSSWTPNLSKLVQNTIPKKSGKKPGPQRCCVSHAAEERNVVGLGDRVKGVEPFQPPEPFRLTWLKGTRIMTCYGCGNKFRSTMYDPVPPEPYDLVIEMKQIRAFT